MKSLLTLQRLLQAQKTLAILPTHLGGLGFWNVKIEAALTRASELVAAPTSPTTNPSIMHAVEQERAALCAVLQPDLDVPVDSISLKP